MAQIGTVRLETQNSGVVDVPVFEPGDSASGIYEFVRVETASGPGFIPVTDPVDATYPYLRVQSQNNGIVAVTDTPGSDIPDSGVARHEFEGDYSDSWSSSVGDFAGTGNGTVFTNTSAVGSQAVNFDAGDNVSMPTPPADIWDAGSVAVWVDFDDTSVDSQFPVGLGDIDGDMGTGRELRLSDNGDYDFIGWGADVNTGVSPNSGLELIAYTWDSNGDVTVYRDDANVIGSATGLSLNTPDNTPTWYYGVSARGPATNDNFAGIIDDPRVYSKTLSSTEVSNLYNSGSI